MAKIIQKASEVKYALLYLTHYKKFRRKAKAIKTEQQNSNDFNRQCSFSIDDVIAIFKDLTENHCQSIFQNKLLSYLKDLHENYGLVVTLYCYFTDGNFDLIQVSDCYAQEFKDNSSWLKFGFHANSNKYNYKEISRDLAKSDYERTIRELVRICGGEDSINQVIRLERFQGSKDAIDGMRCAEILPIKGLLIADDDRKSYYLSSEESQQCEKNGSIIKDNLLFVTTTCRLEKIYNYKSIGKSLFSGKHESIFSHEWIIGRYKIKYLLEKLLLEALNNKYTLVII